MSALYAWLRSHRLFVDCVLAMALGMLSIGQLLHGQWTQLPAWLLLISAVAVRRRISVTAFYIGALGGAVQVAGGEFFRAAPLPSDITMLVLLYTVAAYRPRRASVPALLVSLAGSAVAAATVWMPLAGPGHPPLPQIAFVAALFSGIILLAWVLGDSMRYRRGYYAGLEDKAARLEAERHAQARIAAAAERARIARELHDIVAHHVSVMVVQADGARYALRTDPGRAETALTAISGTGRQALTEMRRLLGVLRSAGEQSGLAPVPGLGELRELLDQARAAGLEVSYTLSGTPRELPEGAELAAYRVVQESLTNTRKHGGLAATAAVTLRYEPDGLTVEVTDDGIASPGSEPAGHGLAGMRERIAMYGGTVQAGPLPGGGFGVTARLPCPAAADAPAGVERGQPAKDESAAEEPVASRPGQQQDGHKPDRAGNALSLGWSESSGLSGAAR
ncbi:MAG TPA: histidine kinase [Streptosporangiaceae bacterium]|nr:histidine kinase [Streptosporangiaceae bacterium]